jgi:hypothetical protein
VAIKAFTFDRALADQFIRFGYDAYQGDDRWIPPFRAELRRELSPGFPFYHRPGNDHRHFLATAGGRTVGRVSAMVNAEMARAEEGPPGLVGFFECVEDPAVGRDLLEAARGWLREARDVRRIVGPMNFDIWHGYRFMTGGFDRDPFLGEPYNKPYYPGYFEAAGFERKRRWHSVEVKGRPAIESLAARGAEACDRLRRQGYRFRAFDPRRFGPEMLRLHALVTASFAGFPDFVPIPGGEFVKLFASSRAALDPRLTLFVDDEAGRPAGFGVALLELSDAVRAMTGRTGPLSRLRFFARRLGCRRVNFYAGGVTPEERTRKSGLGQAGFHHILRAVLDLGYEEMLVTLVAEDNRSNGFLGPWAGDYGREYALFEWKA